MKYTEFEKHQLYKLNRKYTVMPRPTPGKKNRGFLFTIQYSYKGQKEGPVFYKGGAIYNEVNIKIRRVMSKRTAGVSSV